MVTSSRQRWSDHRTGPQAGEQTEGKADGQCQDEGCRRQLYRGGKPRCEVAQHRLAARGRRAEIAMGQLADIVEELHGERPVEPQLSADLGDAFCVGGGTRVIGCGVAGQRPGEQERDDDDADDAGHGRQDTSRDGEGAGHCGLSVKPDSGGGKSKKGPAGAGPFRRRVRHRSGDGYFLLIAR